MPENNNTQAGQDHNFYILKVNCFEFLNVSCSVSELAISSQHGNYPHPLCTSINGWLS